MTSFKINILFAFTFCFISQPLAAQKISESKNKESFLAIPYSDTSLFSKIKYEDIEKSVLLNFKKVTCLNKHYKIIGYTLITSRNYAVSHSDEWTTNVKDSINQLNSGDTVWVDVIWVWGHGKKIHLTQAVGFILK